MAIEAQSLSSFTSDHSMLKWEAECVAATIQNEFGCQVGINLVAKSAIQVFGDVFGPLVKGRPYLTVYRKNRTSQWYAYFVGSSQFLTNNKPTASPFFKNPLDALKWLYLARKF